MDDVLGFRLGRCGLGATPPRSVADALGVPAQDFTRDAVPLALLARLETVPDYPAAVDGGSVVLAHLVRGAIHGCAPADWTSLGAALLADDAEDLARQLGRQVRDQARATGIAAPDQLAAVAAAVRDALAEAPLDRVALHAALRDRLPDPLLPWCAGCASHHVAPMLWRYATVAAGASLDARRRYRLDGPAAGGGGGARAGAAADGGAPGAERGAGGALRIFLRAYGPSDARSFAAWAGLALAHARRVWAGAADALVPADGGHLLAEDAAVLADPPSLVAGVRLLPAGDPALARPNRERLAPDVAVRRRLFRPVASPGAVLRDGRLAGLWRARMTGRRLEVTVEPLGRLARPAVTAQAERVARLRGAADLRVEFG